MAASEYELCLQVGEQIRQRRVQLKMNQSELAERADVARNTVYRIEAGQPGCKMGYLLRVLQVLGVSANDLFCAPIQEQELADLARLCHHLSPPQKILFYATAKTMAETMLRMQTERETIST